MAYKDELYMVWDWDKGHVITAPYWEALEAYEKEVEATKSYFNGEDEIDEDDIGAKTILSKVVKTTSIIKGDPIDVPEGYDYEWQMEWEETVIK